jgi:hypothetical protein
MIAMRTEYAREAQRGSLAGDPTQFQRLTQHLLQIDFGDQERIVVRFQWTNLIHKPTVMFLETDSDSSMPKAAALNKTARFRQRLRANGGEEILLQLPRETVRLLDEVKVSQGLRSRSQAFLQLLEEKGIPTKQMT